ncbi:uncharacterized protein LOC127729412 isoform X2 [Mytilus californianus]|uniref:uncharacterized protein LOC127729412 isoform X2 n=1 Tax=Mytilus californianus TaxID=6549 RepID=UPI002245ED20|nr:uncharacterized protein LOC127729412 isoform X2 [Mytilus californianus]
MSYPTEERSCFLIQEHLDTIPGRKGIMPSTDVYLKSKVYSKDQDYVMKLTCYAFVQPFAISASFFQNSIQIDGIRIDGNKCFHKDGPCLPDKCSCCSNEGFYAFFLYLKIFDIKDLRSVSCEMRTDEKYTRRIASIDLNNTDFTATELKPSIKESNSKIRGPSTPATKIKGKIYKDKTLNKDSSHLIALQSVFVVIAVILVILCIQIGIGKSLSQQVSKIMFPKKDSEMITKKQKDRNRTE